MDALVSALMLLSSLLVTSYFVATGVGRFLSGRATGFTTLGAPRVSFPWSAILGIVEVALGVGVFFLPAPGGMLAAYLAMLLVAIYAWVTVRNFRSSKRPDTGDRASGTQAWVQIGMAGVSVVALVDSLDLISPVVRLFDPAVVAWLLGLGVFAAVLLLLGRRLRTVPPADDQGASPDEAPRPDPGP